MADLESDSSLEIAARFGAHASSWRLAGTRSAGPPNIWSMERRAGAKTVPLAVIFLFAGTLIFSTVPVEAQEGPEATDQELAETFAPILYFHYAEIFRPQSVEVLVGTAQLRQAVQVWFEANVLEEVSLEDLPEFQDESYALDAWYGDNGSSDYRNYSAHRAYYLSFLNPVAGGPPIVAYAHVRREEAQDRITIQYWFFYYYNDGINKHEGDWEMMQIMLGEGGVPEWVVLSQHHGGTRRSWAQTRIEEGTHPAVYVALGSHANYFFPNEVYPYGVTVGNLDVHVSDRTGASGRVSPNVISVPGREDVLTDPAAWGGLEWLPYGGLWGELALQSDFGGPLGPAFKGEQWDSPYAWGMAQPLDTEQWYENRLRVLVEGQGANSAQVSLASADGTALPMVETLGNQAILHSDPPQDTEIVAQILGAPNGSLDFLAVWPDPETSQVTHYRFEDIELGSTGEAILTFDSDGTPTLAIVETLEIVVAPESTTERVPWEAPDVVWVAGILPITDVIMGITIAILAGLVPTIIYAGALFWFDRFEKEPARLLAAAFAWGAIPALIVAIVVRIFFQLPPELAGPEAVEAMRFGVVSPLVEEALKAAAVLYIARRYRSEFDNVLDGIIYGAMVGFGFAMTGNIISYLGSFLLRGFAGLTETILLLGVLYALNQAMYSSIFGAGLGYARLTQSRVKQLTVPTLTFALAVLMNGLHSYAIRNAAGLNVFTLILTWLSVLVLVAVMAWSLRRQRMCIEEELLDEIPEDLYVTLTEPWAGTKQLWRALRSGGISNWRRTRRLRQRCAELAFKKMQSRLFSDEPEMAVEAEALRKEVKSLSALIN
ncbi:MAG: PrsW family intramembrane metalloprotease [Anaerolineales bacterium]